MIGVTRGRHPRETIENLITYRARFFYTCTDDGINTEKEGKQRPLNSICAI